MMKKRVPDYIEVLGAGGEWIENYEYFELSNGKVENKDLLIINKLSIGEHYYRKALSAAEAMPPRESAEYVLALTVQTMGLLRELRLFQKSNETGIEPKEKARALPKKVKKQGIEKFMDDVKKG